MHFLHNKCRSINIGIVNPFKLALKAEVRVIFVKLRQLLCSCLQVKHGTTMLLLLSKTYNKKLWRFRPEAKSPKCVKKKKEIIYCLYHTGCKNWQCFFFCLSTLTFNDPCRGIVNRGGRCGAVSLMSRNTVIQSVILIDFQLLELLIPFMDLPSGNGKLLP